MYGYEDSFFQLKYSITRIFLFDLYKNFDLRIKIFISIHNIFSKLLDGRVL